MFWSIGYAGNPVAHHVKINQLPRFGQTIGSGKKEIDQQGLPPPLQDHFPRGILGKGLDQMNLLPFPNPVEDTGQ